MTGAVSVASSSVVDAGVLADNTVKASASAESTRYCTVCGSIIPDARLKAQPNARQCVPCLEAQGDVERYSAQPTCSDVENSIDFEETKDENLHISSPVFRKRSPGSSTWNDFSAAVKELYTED